MNAGTIMLLSHGIWWCWWVEVWNRTGSCYHMFHATNWRFLIPVMGNNSTL